MGDKMVSIFNFLSESIYIKLSRQITKKIINSIKKPDKILLDQLYRLKQGKKISLGILTKIATNYNIPKREIEKNILLLTSNKSTNIGIKNPKLPFQTNSKDIARLIAAILGDGNLSKNLMVDYNNKNRNLISLVLKSAKNIFGDIDEKIYKKKDGSYQLHFPMVIGIFLFYFGLKPGYKTQTNQKIPSLIFNLNKNSKAIFLRQFFNDEGNVRLKDRRLQVKQTIELDNFLTKQKLRSDVYNYAPKILLDIQKLLMDFGIESKISLGAYRPKQNKLKTDWELSIYRKENLELFKKQIRFDIIYKNELLNKALKSYKFPSAARNKRLQFALEKAKFVQKKYGFINKILLAKESKRSLKVATYYLIDLKKENLVKIIEKPRDKFGHQRPIKYLIL